PRAAEYRWRGHAYHAVGSGVRPLIADAAVLVGDAAGLAFAESGEGIRPAIESGRAAAETLIAADGRFGADDLRPYQAAMTARHPRRAPTPPALVPAMKTVGRFLLR